MDNSVFTPEQVLEKIMQAGEKRICLYGVVFYLE